MTSRQFSRTLVFGLLIAPLAELHAADALEPVLVSATRSEQSEIITPASITVIDRAEIERSGARNVVEVLRGRGGVQIRDTYGDGSFASVDIRGFGPTASSNVLVLVDGRRLNNSSDTAAPDLNSVAIAEVERIEIVHGSSGVLFGNQATGGVINIVTKQSEDWGGEVQAVAGSYGRREGQVLVTDRFDNGLAYRVSGSALNTDNYRDNNALEHRNAEARLDYRYDSGRVFAEFGRISDELETPGALFQDEVDEDRRQSADAYAGDYSDTDTTVGRLGLRQGLSRHWMLEAELAQRETDRDFVTSFRSYPGSRSTQDRRVRTLTPRFVGNYALSAGDMVATIGTDLERTDYELETSLGIQENEQEIDSYYAQVVVPLSQRWSLTTGVRHARVENAITDSYTYPGGTQLDDDVTVGAFGLVFRPSESVRIFARADQNFRFATVEELTNVVTGATVELDTQTGVSYELGIEMTREKLRAKAMIYRLDLENEIAFDSSGYYNVNLDETERKGALLEFSAAPLPRLWAGVVWSYVDAEVTGGPFEGNTVPLVAEHTGTLYAYYDLNEAWRFYGELVAVSERVLGGDFNNEFPHLDAYETANLRVSYARGPWEVSMRLNNLLDEDYSETGAVGYDESFVLRDSYYPSPERNGWVSLRYRFD